MKLAEIFRECGFDWGDYPKTTSSNQQYWVGAIVQELKSEGKIERVSESGPWRLL
jgi:methionyl-tRNA synthetase